MDQLIQRVLVAVNNVQVGSVALRRRRYVSCEWAVEYRRTSFRTH